LIPAHSTLTLTA